MLADDRRNPKPKGQDKFLIAAIFLKGLSATPMEVFRFTRSGDKDKKWKEDFKTAIIKAPEGMRDIVQNIYRVDGDKVLVTGNYFTILDIEL